MKRFWTTASTGPAAATVGSDTPGWQILLDGKPMRLPDGPPLVVPHRPVAEAVADEWQQAGGAVGGEMSYNDLPLTRLAGTAMLRIAPDPEPVELALSRYGESDLLCYRADHPAPLVTRQQALWQPWLDWADQALGARLRVTSGIVHVAQDPVALAALAQAVAMHDPLGLAALGVIVPALGSLVLGLAVSAQRLDAAAAHDLAILDERFQEELWGGDAEATARRALVRQDLDAATRLLHLAGGLQSTRPPRSGNPA